jgi:peptidoglycan hydrolase-like protein with peptidoglycan-binding domain
MPEPKGTVARIIEVAKAEVGTIEGPKDNETKYGKWTGANFLPWCQSFVSWSAFTAGLDPKTYPKSAATIAASDFFKKNNRWADARNDDPTPGDWIYFDFPDDGVNRISHVGLCIKNNGNGTIQVIEGNTSGTSKGDQRNGGMCVEKTRAYVKDNKLKLMNPVVGWGRPVYVGEEDAPLLSKVTSSDAPATKPVAPKAVAKAPVAPKVTPAFAPLKKGSKGSNVKKIQTALKLKADGEFGPGTEKAVIAFQKVNPKLGAADGVVGPKTFAALTKSK